MDPEPPTIIRWVSPNLWRQWLERTADLGNIGDFLTSRKREQTCMTWRELLSRLSPKAAKKELNLLTVVKGSHWSQAWQEMCANRQARNSKRELETASPAQVRRASALKEKHLRGVTRAHQHVFRTRGSERLHPETLKNVFQLGRQIGSPTLALSRKRISAAAFHPVLLLKTK